MAERLGFEPKMDLTIHNGFQDRRFQPLSHLSTINLFKGDKRCSPRRGQPPGISPMFQSFSPEQLPPNFTVDRLGDVPDLIGKSNERKFRQDQVQHDGKNKDVRQINQRCRKRIVNVGAFAFDVLGRADHMHQKRKTRPEKTEDPYPIKLLR